MERNAKTDICPDCGEKLNSEEDHGLQCQGTLIEFDIEVIESPGKLKRCILIRKEAKHGNP